MLKVLLKLLDTASRRVAKTAGNILTKVCTCASGSDGCTLAEVDEIEVLLDALTWAKESVRLCALQVSGDGLLLSCPIAVMLASYHSCTLVDGPTLIITCIHINLLLCITCIHSSKLMLCTMYVMWLYGGV